MTLPTTVNLVFRCRYVGGIETVSEESREVGWFTPEDAANMITQSYLKKEFEDALGGRDVIHFDSFKRTSQATEFLSSRKL